MRYTSTLNEQGVDVIVPAKIQAENPRTFDEETYVVYPFIQGEPYVGKDEEIKEAGRLLGRIHSLSPVDNECELDTYDVFDFTEDEVKESFQLIRQNATPHGITVNPELELRLLQAVRQQAELKQAGLIFVATPHDFKANNLVYT